MPSSLLPVLHAFPPSIDAQGEASLLTPTAQWTTEVFELVAIVTGRSTMLPTPSATSTCTCTLPGSKTIITAACRPLCEALTSQSRVNRTHVAVGRARKTPWFAFYTQTIGIVPTPQPTIMGSYLPYGNDKPWVKYEKFVLAGVVYNNAEYLRKVSSGVHDKIDHLKECTHQIVVEIKESVLKEGEEQLMVAERAYKLCSTNKTVEYVMGLRDNPAADWVQEGAPIWGMSLMVLSSWLWDPVPLSEVLLIMFHFLLSLH
jgi:hypothetical protein